jgi:hypothetical protein
MQGSIVQTDCESLSKYDLGQYDHDRTMSYMLAVGQGAAEIKTAISHVEDFIDSN